MICVKLKIILKALNSPSLEHAVEKLKTFKHKDIRIAKVLKHRCGGLEIRIYINSEGNSLDTLVKELVVHCRKYTKSFDKNMLIGDFTKSEIEQFLGTRSD